MKIGLVTSDGGHLTELLFIASAFEGHETFFITYTNMRTKELQNVYTITNYSKNKLLFFLSFPYLLYIVLKERPDVVVSTGAEIAIPVFYMAKLLGAKVIYIECSARVTELSLTGKYVFPISDVFLVQWKSLLAKCGKKAQYWGSVF